MPAASRIEVNGGTATRFDPDQQRESGIRAQYMVPGPDGKASVTIYSVRTCGQVELAHLDLTGQTTDQPVRVGTEGHIRQNHLTTPGADGRRPVLDYIPFTAPATPATQG
jgi:urease beta subunit